LIGKADAVFFGLDFVARESFAFFFGFDDASGDGIDLEKIVRLTVTGFHGEFANRNAAAGGNVGFVARLHDPASIGEELVDVLPGAGFGGVGHVIERLIIAAMRQSREESVRTGVMVRRQQCFQIDTRICY
jgi:hypothetical protein